MVEAPVQITDEYVKTYLWEHNLVAIDEGDLRKLMQPAKLLLIPALMEQAGWVRKREWQGLTDDEVYDSYSEPCSDSEMVAFAREIEAKLKEKNT
jgi:hypothetical protein